jgi:hypothetical protein
MYDPGALRRLAAGFPAENDLARLSMGWFGYVPNLERHGNHVL